MPIFNDENPGPEYYGRCNQEAQLVNSSLEIRIYDYKTSEALVKALETKHFRYGLCVQDHIPYFLLDFKDISFAIPVLAFLTMRVAGKVYCINDWFCDRPQP